MSRPINIIGLFVSLFFMFIYQVLPLQAELSRTASSVQQILESRDTPIDQNRTRRIRIICKEGKDNYIREEQIIEKDLFGVRALLVISVDRMVKLFSVGHVMGFYILGVNFPRVSYAYGVLHPRRYAVTPCGVVSATS